MIRLAHKHGCQAALRKFALGPPTQVDQFMADVDQGKDVLPDPAMPPAQGPPAALDGTIPMLQPPAFGAGSTVAPGLAGAPVTEPPPMMRPVGG